MKINDEIRGQFVTRQIAEILDTLQYNEYCLAMYVPYEDEPFIRENPIRNSEVLGGAFTAPLYQQVIDWLREKHETHVTIHIDPTRMRYFYSIAYNPGYVVTDPEKITYEAIREAAILKALELIQKQKP